MLDIDRSAPVMVTGATGYVAGWIVKALLDAGLTVHAPVRDPAKTEKTAHLTALAEAAPGDIRFFKADLLDPGSYGEAMQGCSVVFHTASPFTINVQDPQRDLIDPAVKGTRNVLEDVNRTESVRRVVLTSSCAAIYTDAADCANAPGGTLTEEVWNTTASLDYQPYSYSKTLAEKEAWTIAEQQDRWDLVVINPSLVLGPAINDLPTSESFRILKMLGDGTMKAGAPRLGIGVVDVRDLAEAHLAAAFSPKVEGRHIVSGPGTNTFEIAQLLQDKFGATYPLPKRALPKWLFWLLAPTASVDRKFVARNANIAWRADNTKGRRALGLSYRPLKET
ncbi:MAG: NAD-dependent epimerase/dehydratase family protein, partial [Rhodobacteraceae bacterium]|nr:NAD-dependent epimerase/dehydratase family protein [Paracoccaceae bacterium]